MSVLSVAPRRHRVVIIGSGFGGLFAAKHLKRADVDVILIAKTTHHLFQPLLYQVATGILSVGEIAPATRMICASRRMPRCCSAMSSTLTWRTRPSPRSLMDWQRVTPFDSLIVAAGAQQSYFGNDHFAEFAPGMKTIDDALELRGRILGAFEPAEVTEIPSRTRSAAHLRRGRRRPDGRGVRRADRRARQPHAGRARSARSTRAKPG